MHSIINWKTSLGGVILIALALCKAFGVEVPGLPLPELTTALTAGLALIFAKDGSAPPNPPA